MIIMIIIIRRVQRSQPLFQARFLTTPSAAATAQTPCEATGLADSAFQIRLVAVPTGPLPFLFTVRSFLHAWPVRCGVVWFV